MENEQPLISVIMPVFNAECYLKQAIESILNQDLTDFEFIIINDGSTDNSGDIIQSFNDKRIIYLENIGNKGIVYSLNFCVKKSKGKYIARMDADDISKPNRLKKQYEYLESNPHTVLCGSFASVINAKGEITDEIILPTKDIDIKVNQLFCNSFVHPSIMAKSSIFKRFNYSEDFLYVEDYFLFTTISLKYPVANIDEPLIYYRDHENNTTTTKKKLIEQRVKNVIKYQLSLFEKNVSNNRLNLQARMYNNYFLEGIPTKDIEQHLSFLLEKNQQSVVYDKKFFKEILHDKWYNILMRDAEIINALFQFIRSPLFSFRHATPKQIRRLLKISLKRAFRAKIL